LLFKYEIHSLQMKRILLISIFILAYSLPHYAQQTMGLFFNDDKSMNGYTLFSNNQFTYLIDNCGFVVNTWESEYKTINGLFITPDGKLIRQGTFPNSVSAGGAGGIIERYDWFGNLEWSYRIADNIFISHHDMTLMPNGNILLMVWENISQSQADEEGRIAIGGILNEQIWEIKPMPNDEIQIVWKWSALDHVIQDADPTKSNFGNVSQHPELIDINYTTPNINQDEDWLHFNSIDYNEAYDQIIVSSRHNSEMYVIDHSTTTSEAASSSGGTYGKGGDILYRYGNPIAYDNGSASDQVLFQPHDVSWVKHGEFKDEFIIFNNQYIVNTRSRVQIWENPEVDGFYEFSDGDLFGQNEILWSYEDAGFFSSYVSSAQILENGNILATEGSSGEISEITIEKEKVWRYINPVNKNGGPGTQGSALQFNVLFKSERYPANYIGFDNFDLFPGDPVELLPDDIGCIIYPLTSTEDDLIINNTDFYYSSGSLFLKSDNIPKGHLSIYDINGRLSQSIHLDAGRNNIDVSHLNDGLYILKGEHIQAFTFYKY